MVASFVQRYRAGPLDERSRKQVSLANIDGRWRIVEENEQR